MPNLNLPGTRGGNKVPYRPGLYTSAAGNKTITVTSQAQVEALLSKGWTRTSD